MKSEKKRKNSGGILTLKILLADFPTIRFKWIFRSPLGRFPCLITILCNKKHIVESNMVYYILNMSWCKIVS